MREIISFTVGILATLIFMKATAMAVSVAGQNLICYVIQNPFQ